MGDGIGRVGSGSERSWADCSLEGKPVTRQAERIRSWSPSKMEARPKDSGGDWNPLLSGERRNRAVGCIRDSDSRESSVCGYAANTLFMARDALDTSKKQRIKAKHKGSRAHWSGPVWSDPIRFGLVSGQVFKPPVTRRRGDGQAQLLHLLSIRDRMSEIGTKRMTRREQMIYMSLYPFMH